nr:FAD-binding oxidoreductase [Candidatus Sigynarchaeota archaeon]
MERDIFKEIEGIVGSRYVTDSKPTCYSYSMNCDAVLQGIPDVVVRPSTPEEISGIMKVANSAGLKIIPRGGGADLTGGAKPIGDGGVVLDLTRMNKILDIDEKNRIVTVEVGISWSELCEKLHRIGAGYNTGSTGPASGFSATIGGGLSNNSVGGGGAAMYGNVTEQCVGLEVVLPTGDIIFTGAKANSFCDKPFTRFGLGPDYSGLFLGDVGIHGIKTKASLKMYPLPEHAAYSTFETKGDKDLSESARAASVMAKWQHEQLPLHDFYYYTEEYTRLLTTFQVKKNLAAASVNGSVLFYTAVANSQKELDNSVERIEKIASNEGLRKLGDTVEEGNLGKWFYEEDGRWQWANIYWGLYGPEGTSLGTCLKCPTYQVPDYVRLYDRWSTRNARKLADIGGGGANFIAFGVHPCYVDVTGGISIHAEKKHRKLQRELWEDLIVSQIKELGGIHYWMGEIIGQSLVDSGALTPEYYNFMISIKKALDPNKVLSPGKFYLDKKY